MPITIDTLILYLFGVVLGIFIGIYISRRFKTKPIGTLRIDHSDPESPYLFVELKEHPDELMKYKEVVFTVKVEDFIPQK